MRKLSKMLVTRWEKIDDVWQETRNLTDVSKSAMIVFCSEEMCDEDSYIRNVEFIYEREAK